MPDPLRFRLSVLIVCCLSIMMGIALSNPAFAHKLKVFALVEGSTIAGYAYFANGGRPKNLPVRFFAPDGTMLGEVTSNEQGEFAYRPTRRIDHRVEVDSGDGHKGVFLIEADELPADLPVKEPGAAKERGECRWNVLQKSKKHSLIKIELIGPGRRHQIRAGFSHLGFPLLGDELYVGKSWNGELALHAWKLKIQKTLVEAPLPERLKALFKI